MKRVVLACAAAALTLPAAPAAAQHALSHAACEQWRHGQCASWHAISSHDAATGDYDVGHDFGPNHSFLEVGALPRTVVSRYHLGPEFRYVNENGRIYVVNPHTYRVVRVVTFH